MDLDLLHHLLRRNLGHIGNKRDKKDIEAGKLLIHLDHETIEKISTEPKGIGIKNKKNRTNIIMIGIKIEIEIEIEVEIHKKIEIDREKEKNKEIEKTKEIIKTGMRNIGIVGTEGGLEIKIETIKEKLKNILKKNPTRPKIIIVATISFIHMKFPCQYKFRCH